VKLGDLIKKGATANAATNSKVEASPADSPEVAKPKAPPTGLKMGLKPKTTQATPAKAPGTGLKLGGGLPKVAADPKPKAKEVDVDSLDLSALASLDVSEIESTQPDRPAFPDEIEATAPARELPPDLTQQQLQFVESLDVIYTVLHDPDMLGQSIRMIMQELQENKEFIQLVSDHDVHTMIKAIRNVMGIAKIRKEEKATKRKTGGSKRSAASKFDADTLAQLDDMMANSKAFDDD